MLVLQYQYNNRSAEVSFCFYTACPLHEYLYYYIPDCSV